MIFLLFVFAAQFAHGFSPKLQGFLKKCNQLAADMNIGNDYRKFACASNFGVYIQTKSTLNFCEKFRGRGKDLCIQMELNKERESCVDVCKSKFHTGYGGLICMDNCPGFIMAKYPGIFYPSQGASITIRYNECSTKCANSFHLGGKCWGGCMGNLASEYLSSSATSSDMWSMKKEWRACDSACANDGAHPLPAVCKGSCLGAVMGKYKLWWYGQATFGDEESCRYEPLGYKDTEGGYSWTPCLLKHSEPCLSYSVDTAWKSHVAWSSKSKAEEMCKEWPACRGYWEDKKGNFWAMDFLSVRDMKKKRTYSYSTSKGAFEKVCGEVSNEKFVKREVAYCGDLAPIRTRKECIQAAEYVGLVGKISNPVEGSYSSDPDGCYFNTRLGELYLNNSPLKDSKATDKISLCKSTAATESEVSAYSRLQNLLEMLIEEEME